jgi:hypothetical protein
MVPKLTLDGGLLRESVLLPAIRTLKKWETEGKIELFEADRAKETRSSPNIGWPGAPPPAKPHTRFKAAKKSASGGVSFQQISAVLFPQRDPHRLNMTEVNDVAHLLRHHSMGNTMFVTTNAQNFILEGKRELLQAIFKIMIMTPDEAVMVLQKSHDLEPATKKQVAHE